MPRGLDHIVHAVRDLDAGADLYRRCGFTVGARNKHSWGTHNHIVQLPGFFVEVLTLAEPNKLGNDGFSQLFGHFNGEFIKRHDGLSLMILESKDAAADRKAFAEAGISASDTLKFEREGKKPDGTPVKVAFSLAFAHDAKAPDAGFAVCQQHYPENFWNPAFQEHANGVAAVGGAVMVADNPSDHHVFASAFAGQRDIQSTSSGISIETPRGQIQIMDPSAFRDHFGVAPPEPGADMRIAAIRFRTHDLAQAESALRAGNLPHATHMGRIVVAPADALGATLVFEAA